MKRHTADGMGLGGGIFLVFLTLKLTSHIDWSWWWVTAPLWAPFVFLFGIWVTTILIVLGARIAGAVFHRRR